MLMQNDKSGAKPKNQANDITKTLINALQFVQDKDPELKKEAHTIKIENAAEITTADSKKAYLVHVSKESIPSLHKVHAEVIKKLESKLSHPIVIVPARSPINGNLFRRYRGKKVPRTETLSHIYDSFLQDVVYPAAVVGKRIRFPKSKGRQFKVQVDKLDRDSIEYKVNAIAASYKALTNRDLSIEFQ